MSEPGKKSVDSFLKLMEMLETSGGKNLKHRRMDTGIHSGSQAQGRVGIMPKTAQELANRRRLSGENDPIDDAILKAGDNTKAIEYYLQQYPEKLSEYERQLAEKVITRAGGDPKLAAGAWLYGHNNMDLVKRKLEADKQYQERIEKYMDKLPLKSGDLTFVEKLTEDTKRKALQNLGRSEQWPSIKLKKP